MKLGIVGAGMIVNDLFNFIHDIDGIELEAIASTPKSIDKVKDMAEKQNIKKYYPAFEDVISDEEVEVVYIGTPNHLHYEMCKQALNANKHVICEKPFTSNIQELKDLVKLAGEKHLILLEAISTQYLPNVLKMKELLEEVGNVRIISANYSQYSSRYNAFKEGKILPAFDPSKSGGALMDLNIYNIHLAVALFGKPENVLYSANVQKGIDTSGVINLDYGNFKAVLIGSKDCKAPIVTNIQGDKGCFSITSPANTVASFTLLKNDGTQKDYNLQNGAHRMSFEFKEFVKIIHEKDYDRANEMLAKSMIAMEIATTARKSANIIFDADMKTPA